MSDVELHRCFPCGRDLPITAFANAADGKSFKGQCRECRSRSQKELSLHNKRVREHEELGLPPPPKRARGSASNRTGTLNDITCPKCGVALKRQTLDEHLKYVKHEGEPPIQCAHCPFTCDCMGHMKRHYTFGHNLDLEEELNVKFHRSKKVYFCTAHAQDFKRFQTSAFYRTEEQRRKARERRSGNKTLDVAMAARAQQQRTDASEHRVQYVADNHHVRKAAPGREQDPLRVNQRQHQEKSLATRSSRIAWKYEHYAKVKEIWRRHHVKHAVSRAQASRVYARGNTRLKWQQLRHGAMTRGLEFTLTEAAAAELMQKPCFYCDVPAQQGSRNGLCGVDCVDNTAGYVPGNCVPCCAVCNVMKNALGVVPYLSHLDRVYRHIKLDRADTAPMDQSAAEVFEDTVLQWKSGASTEVVTNAMMMKCLVQTGSDIPLAAAFNNRSRLQVASLLEFLGHVAEDDLPLDDVDPNADVVKVLRAGGAQDMRDALCDGFYTVMQTVVARKRAVHYAGNIAWELTDDQAVALMHKYQCVYCGFNGNIGIDRLDSTKSYNIDNVVPACHMCNITKNAFPLSTFLGRVYDTVQTLGLDANRDVHACLLQRAAALELTNFVVTRASAGKVAHFGVTATTSRYASTRAKVMRANTVALVYQYCDNRRTVLYHSMPCGKAAASKSRLVNVSDLRRRFPDVVACPKCVTDSELAEDCEADLRALDVPWLGEHEQLNLKRTAMQQALRVQDVVITDLLSDKYHTAVHMQRSLPVAVMPLREALKLNPKLTPCARCVCDHEDAGLFVGTPSLQTLVTEQECVEFYVTVQQEKRRYNAMKKAEGRKGGE